MKIKKITCIIAALLFIITFTACSANSKTHNVTKIMEKIESRCILPEMLTLSTVDKLTQQYGIEAEDVKQFAVKTASGSLNQDEIVIIEAANADAASKIQDKLEDRYKSKLNQCKDYLPEEYEIIKKCSVEKNGNYVCMFISSDHDKMTEIYKSFFN